jgi:NitT/TauT family transport system substrate-binding protein
MRIRHTLPFLVAVALVALVATGCGDSEDSADSSSGTSTSSGGAGNLTKVKVGFTLSAPNAPLYIGMRKGFFKEEGLEVQPVPLDGSAVVTAAVNSGNVDIGGGALDGMMLAATNGVPVKVIAPGSSSFAPKSTSSNDVTNAVIVGPKSDIRTPKDLEGKTIAVNQLKGLIELGIRASAERAGVDPNTFKFRALPFPEAVQAVTEGKVDAAGEVEPFIGAAHAQGARTVLTIYPLDPQKYPEWWNGGWYTSESYLGKHKDTVAAFSRAMIKSNQYSNDHEAEERAIIPTFTSLKKDVADKIVLGGQFTKMDVPQAKEIAKLQQKYGFVTKPVDVDSLIVTFDGDDAGK